MRTNIGQLRSGMSNLTIEAKVIEKSETKLHNGMKRATAILEDETGKIPLNLWRNQIDQVKEGDVIRVPQAFIHGRGTKIRASSWKNIEIIDKKF